MQKERHTSFIINLKSNAESMLRSKLTFIFFLILSLQSFGQGRITVTGIVSNERNAPLAGVSIIEKGTPNGTSTKEDGSFSISVAGTNSTLEVSSVGYGTQILKVGNHKTLTLHLTPTGSNLEEVVVVGYGTQRVTKVSGAIATVKAADIEKSKAVRTEEALQGRASGVTIIQSGSPGSSPTVIVRGIPNFSNPNPVVIIDGVPQTLADLNSISPSDIESLNVLKDASTTAIYGVRGGNGVIVVTTKTGRRNQKPEFSVSSSYGVQESISKLGVLNATEYAAMINEGSVASGGNIIYPDLTKLGVGTNWQNEIFKRAPIQSHSISARGGSDRMSYFLSGSYLSQGGIVGGIDKSKFDRATFTANLNIDLSSKLKFILNTTGVYLNSKGVLENSFNSVIGNAINFDPTVPVYNTAPNTVGLYGFSRNISSEIFNPLTQLDNTYNKTVGSKVYGKFELQYDVLKNLKFTTRFGYTKYDDNSKSFTPLVFYGPTFVTNTLDSTGKQVAGSHNSVSHNKNSNFGYTWETFGNYNFSLKQDHHFETVLGFSAQAGSGNAAGATRQDVPYNSWQFADFTAATGVNSAGDPTNGIPANLNAQTGYYYQYFSRNISYFTRINYDYREKYLASFSGRRDGSYVFGPANKFANFFAGSLGWVVSKEDFFHSNTINYLKIRGSYGSSGNSNADPRSTFVQISSGGPDYGSPVNSNGYNFGEVFYPGATVASAANEALRWEKTLQSNIGFDITLLKNKISFSADYFEKRVSGLLFTPRLPLYLGTIRPPDANIGTTKSTGLDLALTYNQKVSRSLNLSNSFTFTTFKSVVTATNDDGTAKLTGGDFFNGQPQTVTVFEKGFSPGYFYGYKTDGLFQNVGEINKSAKQPGAQPGDIRFVDINGDGVIDEKDRTKIGDPFPDFTLGWNLVVDYKNFDFTAFTYASVGNDVYRAYERNQTFTNKDRSILARWTGEGSTNDAKNPRYTFTDPNSNIRVSDRYVEDGSFVKIKTLQLGYTFASPGIKKVFSRLRAYAQVKNAFTFTKYQGFDPEISGGILNTGIDRGAYPQARTYYLGVDFRF